MLDHFVQYVGSSPYGSPAVLCSIAHMQTNDGVWYPMGGTRAVPVGIGGIGALSGRGVPYRRFGQPRCHRRRPRIGRGAWRPARSYGCPPSFPTWTACAPIRNWWAGHRRNRFPGAGSSEPACSGVVLYLGLDRAYEHLAHHDFVFSRDPEEEFDAIYKRGEPAPGPDLLSGGTRAHRAWRGAARWRVALCTGAHAISAAASRLVARCCLGYRRTILDKLARTAGLEDLESRIVVERVLTPQDIHDRYRVLNGAIYGLASHGRMFGAFKPGNRSRDLAGLYLCGRGGPSRAWHADGADVRLDCGRRGGCRCHCTPDGCSVPDPLAERYSPRLLALFRRVPEMCSSGGGFRVCGSHVGSFRYDPLPGGRLWSIPTTLRGGTRC